MNIVLNTGASESFTKDPGQCESYAIAVYETMDVMKEELLTTVCQNDRFACFCVRQRYMSQISKEAAFGQELKKLRETTARGK